MKSTRIIAIAATILMCLPALTLLAQNPPNGPASGSIDGGVLLLVAGGAALGYWKLKKGNVKMNDQIAYYESLLNDSPGKKEQ